MPSNKRRPHNNEEISEETEDFDMEGKLLQVDFEGKAAEDSDFHGIKQLLHQLLIRAPLNTSALADVIIGQNYVGSVLKQCLDEEISDDGDEVDVVFGVTTTINLTKATVSDCISQMKTFLLEKTAANPEFHEHLKVAFERKEKKVGWLINERFVNISPLVTVPLFSSLLEEIKNAQSKGMEYKFDQLLLISKLYKRFDDNNKLVEETFTNAEEEIFYEHAIASFDYNVKADTDNALGGSWTEDDPLLIPYRRFILFDAQKFPEILSNITAAVKI